MIQISEEPLSFVQPENRHLFWLADLLCKKALYPRQNKDYRAKVTLREGQYLVYDRVFPQNILGFLLKRKEQA